MGELLNFNKPQEKVCICNFCGKQITSINRFELSFLYPYGSKHDYDLNRTVLHVECLDKLTEKMISSFKVNPIHEYTGSRAEPYGDLSANF